MQIPTTIQIEALHKKYASSDEIFSQVWEHCNIVKEIALDLVEQNKLKIDNDLLVAGALLHDIGAYKVYYDRKNYIKHGVIGAEILKSEGVSLELQRFASHHTGVGLDSDDIKNLGIETDEESLLAETLEEKLVMYADKFHSKTEPPTFNSVEFYKQKVQEFGPGKLEIFETMLKEFGSPDLEKFNQKYGYKIR